MWFVVTSNICDTGATLQTNLCLLAHMQANAEAKQTTFPANRLSKSLHCLVGPRSAEKMFLK